MRGLILLETASVSAPMQLFRQGLLEGCSIALSGDIAGPVRDLLAALGARIAEPDPELAGQEEAVSAWARKVAPLDALVCGEDSERHPDGDGWLAHTWTAVRAVATEAFIPGGEGRVVLVAPREGGAISRAALQNLARTVSVEWARFGITTVAIVPGADTCDDEVAQLVAFFRSHAGAYYSGCRFDLGPAGRETRS